MDYKELLAQAKQNFDEARSLLEKADSTAEDRKKAADLIAAGQEAKSKIDQLKALETQAGELAELSQKAREENSAPSGDYAKFGEFLGEVARYGDIRDHVWHGRATPRLAAQAKSAKRIASDDSEEPAQGARQNGQTKSQWGGEKTMIENVGNLGGFTVPDQFVNDVVGLVDPYGSAFTRATRIPMAYRQVRVPVLDQTGTTAGVPSWFGGVQGKWTEEAATKADQNMKFRQMSLVAHKLVCKSWVSDELLEDSAVGLAAFLTGPMGFRGAIEWQREYAFLRGTGAGMPQGIVGAGATINVAAAAALGFTWADALNMLESFLPGSAGVWVFNQRHLSNVYSMVDTAGNALFTPNINDTALGRLYGYPVLFSDKLPVPGVAGSALLIDPRYYYIGEKGAPVFASTNAEKFSDDLTTFRVVYRVDGQPGLSAPITLEDGSTQVSPFVQLGTKST